MPLIMLIHTLFCLLLVRPLSMSSNTFVNGARMSGVCAFIVGYFEYEHKTLLIHRPATLIFRIYLCGIVCITIKQPTHWLNVMPILFLTSTSWYIHVYMVNNNIHWAENLSELRVCPWNSVVNSSTLLCVNIVGCSCCIAVVVSVISNIYGQNDPYVSMCR